MQTVTEKSTAYLTVSFYDKSGALAIPNSATYRIDDVQSGSQVRTDTAISPIASSVEIKLTTTDNAILNSAGRNEQRRVTVVAIYGVDDQVTDEHVYEVASLIKVT